MSIESQIEDDEYEEIPLDTECPNCNKSYDEIDYEYQICQYCKFHNGKKEQI